jgi:hypothetical protein
MKNEKEGMWKKPVVALTNTKPSLKTVGYFSRDSK